MQAITLVPVDTFSLAEYEQGVCEGYEQYREGDWLSVEEVLQAISDFSTRPESALSPSFRLGVITGLTKGYQEDFGEAAS